MAKFPYAGVLKRNRPNPVEFFQTWTMVHFGQEADAGRSLKEWRFRVKGANGEIVVSSEGYTTKADAERGAATLKRLMKDYR